MSDKYKGRGIEKPNQGEDLFYKNRMVALNALALVPTLEVKSLFRHIPDGMHRNREIICAIDAWDFGDPEPLAALLRPPRHPPHPFVIAEQFLEIVGDIVSGKRIAKSKKAITKLKIPAKHRMPLAWTLSMKVSTSREMLKVEYGGLKGAEAWVESVKNRHIDWAKKRGRKVSVALAGTDVEPAQLRKGIYESIKLDIEATAHHWGVSVETIENLLRDFDKKVEAWPSV